MSSKRSRRITLTDTISPIVDEVIASSSDILHEGDGINPITRAALARAEEHVSRARARARKTSEPK